MIHIERPGQEPLEIDVILIDFEGTLASDRRVHPKAKDKINLLSKRVRAYILAKEEKERVMEVLKWVKAEIIFLKEEETSLEKLNLLRQLGAGRAAAIGNGADDALMVDEAGLGICVIGREGMAGETMQKADLVFPDIVDALDFFLKPLRQKSTLGK